MISPTKKKIPMELGLNRSDKTRLWIAGVLFVVVLGSFLGLRIYGNSGEKQKRKSGGGFDAMIDKGQTVKGGAAGAAVALPVTEIEPSWAREIGELTFEQANNTNERPFWLVLNYVKNLGVDGYAALRAAADFRIEAFPEGSRRLLRVADQFRFHHVALSGRIMEMHFEEKLPANPGEIDRLYSAVLLTKDETVVRLVSPRPWGEYGAEPTARSLGVEGIFYKKWKYQAMSGRVESAPLVIVTGLFD